MGGRGHRMSRPAGRLRAGPRDRRRLLDAYSLLAPGLVWLGLFFLVPMFFMGIVSLESGSIETGFAFTWEVSNYTDAISQYSEQFLRSFMYGGSPPRWPC